MSSRIRCEIGSSKVRSSRVGRAWERVGEWEEISQSRYHQRCGNWDTADEQRLLCKWVDVAILAKKSWPFDELYADHHQCDFDAFDDAFFMHVVSLRISMYACMFY
jgi:hypothetical protein